MNSRSLRTILTISIVFMAVLAGVMFMINQDPPPRLQLTTPTIIVPETALVPIVPKIVQEANLRNNTIRSFTCDSVVAKIWDGGVRFRLTGDLRYEKINNFRMILKSFFGKEVDLGSNQDLFWYWSRRDSEPGLYYAVHSDYLKTRLKTAFNPVFLKSSLGIDSINTDKARFIERENSVLVIREETSAVEDEVLHITFVNKSSNMVEGFLITDLDQNPIASCEIQEYENGLPSKVVYAWYRENKIMQLEFKNPRVNIKIEESWWQLPNYQPQINMADE